MQAVLSSFSPGSESVYGLIYGLIPQSGGVTASVLWYRFYREYLSHKHLTPPAAVPLLKEKKRPVPALFNEYLLHLHLGEVLTYTPPCDKTAPGVEV